MDKYELRRIKLKELMDERCEGRVVILAKKLGRSDSYVARMLYPPSKAGYKRIGEDMADLIAQTFSLDRSALEVAPPAEGQSRELQWITAKEAQLLSLFRSIDAEGQDSMLKLGEILPKVLLAGIASHKS